MAAFNEALEGLWRRAHGGALLPEEIALVAIDRIGDDVEVRFESPRGIAFAFRAKYPDNPRDVLDPGVEGVNPAEQWAMWEVLVPLVEHLQTDAQGRIAPDHDGVRRLRGEGPGTRER